MIGDKSKRKTTDLLTKSLFCLWWTKETFYKYLYFHGEACAFILRIILRLRVPQLMVFSALIGNERGVRALLYHSTFVEHGDRVAELAGG